MKKLLLALSFIFALGSHAQATCQSTINTVLPLANTPVTSAPVRNNFAAAAQDIDNLCTLVGQGGGGGGSTSPGGSPGQIQWNSSGSFAGLTMNGDCTITASTGAIVCTKSSGTAFGTAAFKNTGTSGTTIPLLNTANTWSNVQTFNANDLVVGGQTAITQCLQINSAGVVSGTNNVCGGGGGGGSVNSIATNNGVTGGTITTTGTIGLASVTTNSALCNNSGSTLPPTSANCTVTGSGNLVMAASPTLATPQITGNLNLSSGSQYQINGTQIAASNLSNGTTGTGAIMLTASPTTTGTLTGASATLSGALAIGTLTQSAGTSLDLGSTTGAELLPVGTTGQRPGTGKNGMIRYNSTLNTLEGYVNAGWNQVSTGGNFAINVTAWPYAAACDGTTNDTSTIQTAAAVGLPIFIPPTTGGCAVSSLAPPIDSWWIGMSSPQYTSNPSGKWSHMVPAAGASAVWNYNATGGVLVQNLDTLGSSVLSFSSTVVCINAGNTSQDEFLFSSYRFCGNGGFGDAGDYPNTVISIDTNWIANGQNTSGSGGLVNLVDSEIDGGSFTSNRNGLSFGPGANNNVISPMTRIEFNEFTGVSCNGATKEIFDGQYDRNATAAIAFTNCGRSTGLSGNGSGVDSTGELDGITVRGIYTRNGSSATAGAQAQFEFGGGNTNITFNGITTSHDCGDAGCGSDTNSPKYVVEYADSTDVGIRFVGGNLNGYTTAFENHITGSGPGEYGIVGGIGAESIFPYNNTFNGAMVLTPVTTPSTPTITPFGAGGAATWSYKVVAILGNGLHTAASTAGTTTSGNATLSTTNYNAISWPYVAGAFEYQIYRTVHGTSPTTIGLIATIPATQGLNVLANVFSEGGGGQLWDTGLAGDASVAPTTNNTGTLTLSAMSGTNCLEEVNGVVTSTGSACGGSGSSPGGNPSDVQFNSAGTFGADDSFSYAGSGSVTIGTAGHTGNLLLKGTSSGTATIVPQAAAGTPTLTLGTSSGTPVVTASAPLSITTATGNIVITGAAGQILAGATPAFTATPTLGASGTLGSLTFGNATSGTLILEAVTGALGTPTVSLPAATDTLMGKATTDTMTNKTFDTAGTGNSFKINGTGVTAVSGTGAVVLATSPTLITPALGVPASGTLTNATGLPISTGVSGLGGGVATFLATPSSANLATAITDETGSGVAVFGTTPTFTTSIIDPLVIGGSATSAALTLESTSGIGATDSIIMKTGSQVTRLTIATDGGIEIGTTQSFGAGTINLGSTTPLFQNGVAIGGGGGVTSVATASPITGGTITSTGTIACATCVTSSSPGTGIAHFAGATQAVTSSAVSLTADVSGTLPSANMSALNVIHAASTYTTDTGGNLYPGVYTGGGANVAKHDFGWQVKASLAASPVLEMRFQMPSHIPAGTFKLVSYCLANATTGNVKYTVSDADVANGASPSGATLTGETQTSITWTAVDNYVVTKTALTSSPVADDVSVVAVTYNATGWTLAQPLTCRFVELWE